MHFFGRSKSANAASTRTDQLKNDPKVASSSASTAAHSQLSTGHKLTSSTDKEDAHGERISIRRSDGMIHDLNNVISQPGITEFIHTSGKDENENSKQPHPKEDDHTNICLPRSDGLTHDIIQIVKAVSDAQGDTMRPISMRPTRAPSVGKIDLSSISSLLGTSSSSNSTSNQPLTSPAHQSLHQSSLSSNAQSGTIQINREISTLYFPKSVRILHFSDTHNFLIKLPKRSNFLPHGDVMVHTGNFTNGGTEQEFINFNDWLGSVTDLYHYRIVIFGHRDVKVYGNNWDLMKRLLSNATHVLCHNDTVILGIRFYGAPWHWGHKANYTVRLGAPSSTNGRFDDIPVATQVLLSHGPAYDRLDMTVGGIGGTSNAYEHWGSRELSEAIRTIKPGLHLHGHVKDARGFIPAFGNSPLSVNSSMVDKDVTVLYAAPHVIRATQTLFDRANNCATWSFAIDSLE
jgi:hypothetical protein